MEMPFGGDKHEFCLAVINLCMFTVAPALTSHMHDCIE